MAGQGEEYQTKKVNINRKKERQKSKHETLKENSHSAHQVTLCAPLRNSSHLGGGKIGNEEFIADR